MFTCKKLLYQYSIAKLLQNVIINNFIFIELLKICYKIVYTLPFRVKYNVLKDDKVNKMIHFVFYKAQIMNYLLLFILLYI